MKKSILILLAGVVWLFAGFMVAKIGLEAYSFATFPIFLTLTGIVVFLIFYLKIFLPMLIKNIKRIGQLNEHEAFFWSFMDKKSYIIMFVMMAFGMSLRKFDLFPPSFFFSFYTGLGSALFLAGLSYLAAFFKRLTESGQIK